MDRKDPAMPDEPTTRKPEVTDDRADPEERGGWFFGPDAVRVLVRAAWGAAGVSVLGLLLLGGVWWTLSGLGDILRAIEIVLRSK